VIRIYDLELARVRASVESKVDIVSARGEDRCGDSGGGSLRRASGMEVDRSDKCLANAIAALQNQSREFRALYVFCWRWLVIKMKLFSVKI